MTNFSLHIVEKKMFPGFSLAMTKESLGHVLWVQIS